MNARKSPLVGRRSILLSVPLVVLVAGCGRRRRGPFIGFGDDDGVAVEDSPSGLDSPPPSPRRPGRPGDEAVKLRRSVVSIRGSGGSRTGFVFRDGYVITTAGVVADNGDSEETVQLGLPGGSTVDGVVVGVAPDDGIAVVRTEAELPPAATGRAPDLRVGDTVYAVGAPKSDAPVRGGVVSALRRQKRFRKSGPRRGMIQTDIEVDHTDGGGPLASGGGDVVGVVVPGSGLSFAIPIKRALDVARRLSE